MNMEQRARIVQAIRQTEILLAYAMKAGDMNEADRLERERARLVELI